MGFYGVSDAGPLEDPSELLEVLEASSLEDFLVPLESPEAASSPVVGDASLEASFLYESLR
jgi:hypothetical protein